ncbi:putative transporter [Yarrowia sp. B02]|nr:putative transporter [Yarrowia sp. B02]
MTSNHTLPEKHQDVSHTPEDTPSTNLDKGSSKYEKTPGTSSSKLESSYEAQITEVPYSLDKETDSRLLRKTDLYLCPIMIALYAVQYMDKASNSTAAVMGLREDLGMKGNDYSWSGTAFYLGYLIFEFPSVYLLQHFPMAKTLSAFIILWGVVLCLHAAPNYAGFIALRTILGMLESAVTPAFVILTAQWYKREEQFLRTSIWFGSNGLGILIGSFMAYGLAVNDHLPIAGWRLVFIITGVITIALGIVFAIHVPDDPSKAWFLTEEERKLVILRIKDNQQGFENKKFKKDQFIEAFTDHRTWIYFFFCVCQNIPSGGITNFNTILFSETLGLGPIRGLLLQTPQGAVEFVGCILFGIIAQITQQRLIVSLVAQAISLMAMCLLAFMPDDQRAGLAGLYLLVLYPLGLICMLSSVASNTSGHTKKVTVNAILLIGYCVGNIIGPQTFRAKDAPMYVPAKVSMVVLFCIAIALNGVLLWVNIVENKWREKNDPKPTPEELERVQLLDLTDKQNRYFRYAM